MIAIAMFLMLISAVVLAYTIGKVVNFIINSSAIDERMKPSGKHAKKSVTEWTNTATIATAAHDQDNENNFGEEDFADDEEVGGFVHEDEEEEENNHNVHNEPQQAIPPLIALAQPPAPAPLLRRDSGQSDDHDMNCLHFFALNNEHIEHITQLIETEHATKRQFDQRRTSHRLHLQNMSMGMHSSSIIPGKVSYPLARKQFTHTHTEVTTSSSSTTGSIDTTTVSTVTRSLLAPMIQSPLTPPVRSSQLDINARVKFHCLSPLHFAAMNSSPDFISTLIRNGANINSTDMHCRTPLRLATNTRRAEIVRHLLSYSECVDLPDSEGTTALRSAVFRSDVEMVRVFLQTRSRLAHMPLEGGSDGSDGDKSSGIHALHVCASFGNLEMINMLVHEIGVDVDARDTLGRTPLMYAATKGKWQAVQYLLSISNSDTSVVDHLAAPALNSVFERSDESIVTLVGEDELNGAVSGDKLRKSKLKDSDPNAQDGHGWTALHYAAVATKAEPLKTIEVLISRGAIVDAKEFRYALTPLHMAAKSGHVQILKLLIEKGANPNHRTTDNRTCLCFAAYGSHLDCIRALISSNPDVIRPTISRKKRDMGFIETVARILLDVPFMIARFVWSITFGFRPSIQFDAALYEFTPASNTLSPLHLAIRAKEQSQEVIDMLLDAGADINAGIPIEVGSEWFSLSKRLLKKIIFTGQSSCNIETEDDDDKIFYVNPVCFALAFGNPDVAVKLLKHRTQTCLASILQGMTILILSVFQMRFDCVWRILFKTPSGIFLVMLFSALSVFSVFHILTPRVDMNLLKSVWSSCGGPQNCTLSCKQHLLSRECCAVSTSLPFSDPFSSGAGKCWSGFLGRWSEK
ncbi:hypothetical protein BDR26DRAFT_861033 [Obelidium mucronatum]|nr:hypothetical protein BDR26DRAFT_861033 [Obelidium mucronatum]